MQRRYNMHRALGCLHEYTLCNRFLRLSVFSSAICFLCACVTLLKGSGTDICRSFLDILVEIVFNLTSEVIKHDHNIPSLCHLLYTSASCTQTCLWVATHPRSSLITKLLAIRLRRHQSDCCGEAIAIPALESSLFCRPQSTDKSPILRLSMETGNRHVAVLKHDQFVTKVSVLCNNLF